MGRKVGGCESEGGVCTGGSLAESGTAGSGIEITEKTATAAVPAETTTLQTLTNRKLLT